MCSLAEQYAWWLPCILLWEFEKYILENEILICFQIMLNSFFSSIAKLLERESLEFFVFLNLVVCIKHRLTLIEYFFSFFYVLWCLYILVSRRGNKYYLMEEHYIMFSIIIMNNTFKIYKIKIVLKRMTYKCTTREKTVLLKLSS